MEKTSKIKSCRFVREWQGQNGTVYYHAVELENGDKGEVGARKQDPEELQPGKELTYTITSREFRGNTEYTIKPVRKSGSGGGGKGAPRDEARITYLSCLASACTLHQQSSMVNEPEKVLETAEKFYRVAITKTSLK